MILFAQNMITEGPKRTRAEFRICTSSAYNKHTDILLSRESFGVVYFTPFQYYLNIQIFVGRGKSSSNEHRHAWDDDV